MLKLTVKDFKNLILYTLEDYLFNNKSDLQSIRQYFTMPEITITEEGIFNSEGIIDPTLFAQMFIKRATDVWQALMTLNNYSYQELPEETKSSLSKHLDYSYLGQKLKRNEDLTIHNVPFLNNTSAKLITKKIAIASVIADSLDEAETKLIAPLLGIAIKTIDFKRSPDYAKLVEEHTELFRIGIYVEGMESRNYDMASRFYSNASDSERLAWRAKYDKLKREYEKSESSRLYKQVIKEEFSFATLTSNALSNLDNKIGALKPSDSLTRN